jgi:hypothetical protein
MTDAYKCDACKQYKDGLPKPTGKYGIFDLDKSHSEPMQLCHCCKAKLDKIFNVKPRKKYKARKKSNAIKPAKIAKKKRGRPKKEVVAPAKPVRGRPKKKIQEKLPETKAKETYVLPKPEDGRKARMKFIGKRVSNLLKEGYSRSEASKKASKEYQELNTKPNEPVRKRNGTGQSGSSRCKNCNERIPLDDKYCPTCQMVFGEEAEA